MVNHFFQKTQLLSPSEQSRAAHRLLKLSLAEHYAVEPDSLEIAKDGKGAPFVPQLPEVSVSLSHTRGMVACAFSGSARVGIDVEAIGKHREKVEKRVFTGEEIALINNSSNPDKAFFALWTLKESYLKALGTGFADNAKSVSFSQLWPQVVSNLKDCSFECREVDGFYISVCEIML